MVWIGVTAGGAFAVHQSDTLRTGMRALAQGFRSSDGEAPVCTPQTVHQPNSDGPTSDEESAVPAAEPQLPPASSWLAAKDPSELPRADPKYEEAEAVEAQRPRKSIPRRSAKPAPRRFVAHPRPAARKRPSGVAARRRSDVESQVDAEQRAPKPDASNLDGALSPRQERQPAPEAKQDSAPSQTETLMWHMRNAVRPESNAKQERSGPSARGRQDDGSGPPSYRSSGR